MSGDFTLKVHELRKQYDDRVVLDVDDLALESGRCYALVGPNGSGKSTFLKMLAGVEDQTSGFVDVEGDVPRSALSVGYMPQKSYVFGFSVFKNVAMALAGSSLPKDEARERVMRALEEVGMTAFADKRGSGLSGGESQRVALARMLVWSVTASGRVACSSWPRTRPRRRGASLTRPSCSAPAVWWSSAPPTMCSPIRRAPKGTSSCRIGLFSRFCQGLARLTSRNQSLQ